MENKVRHDAVTLWCPRLQKPINCTCIYGLYTCSCVTCVALYWTKIRIHCLVLYIQDCCSDASAYSGNSTDTVLLLLVACPASVNVSIFFLFIIQRRSQRSVTQILSITAWYIETVVQMYTIWFVLTKCSDYTFIVRSPGEKYVKYHAETHSCDTRSPNGFNLTPHSKSFSEAGAVIFPRRFVNLPWLWTRTLFSAARRLDSAREDDSDQRKLARDVSFLNKLRTVTEAPASLLTAVVNTAWGRQENYSPPLY